MQEYFTVYPILERRVKNLIGRELMKGRYVEIPPDAEGRVYSKQLDLLFQIDPESEELQAFDATTGRRLLISDEEEAGREKAEAALSETEAALGETEAALGETEAALGKAEAALGKAEAALDKAEAALGTETEKRQQAERRGVEDLCIVLGLTWNVERKAQVEDMTPSQLEALRGHLVREKNWPDDS